MIKLACPDIGIEEQEAVQRVLDSGQLTQGQEVEAFEQELAEYLGVKHVVCCSSGTAALLLALKATDNGKPNRPKRKVAVSDFTFPASVNVIEEVGAKPYFIDVDDTFNMDVNKFKKMLQYYDITDLMMVHQFGYPVKNIDKIQMLCDECDVNVIEDAACALGSALSAGYKYNLGTFGEVGCFSFHPRKVMTTGEGGAVVTNDFFWANALRLYRNHGVWAGDMCDRGGNYRMTEIAAAIGREQLRKLPMFLKKRSLIANIYNRFFGEDSPQSYDARHGCRHVDFNYQSYVIKTDPMLNSIPNVIGDFRRNGIEVSIGSYAVHTLEYYQKYKRVCCSNSASLAKRTIALPMHTQMTEEDAHRVVAVASKVLYGN